MVLSDQFGVVIAANPAEHIVCIGDGAGRVGHGHNGVDVDSVHQGLGFTERFDARSLRLAAFAVHAVQVDLGLGQTPQQAVAHAVGHKDRRGEIALPHFRDVGMHLAQRPTQRGTQRPAGARQHG